jgi:hypothetical protein
VRLSAKFSLPSARKKALGKGPDSGSARGVHRRVWARGSGIWRFWRMWAWSGHMAWHMTTLDTQMWPRGEVPGLGLIDEDVDLIKGVDCGILAHVIV